MKTYTDTKDWIETCSDESRRVRVGLSRTAIEEIGPIVWLDLPSVGQVLKRGDVAVVIESTKAAMDIHAPISGKVLCVNEKLSHRNEESLSLLNNDPEGEGWMYELEQEEDM